jgi:hypothetical protein
VHTQLGRPDLRSCPGGDIGPLFTGGVRQ